jgi:hypothetical protein
MNVDTIRIVDKLYSDEGVRAAAVVAAQKATPDLTKKQAEQALAALKLPIGWNGTKLSFKPPASRNEVYEQLLRPWFGWLLTAFAATLGAPFWFDVLNKVMVIRSTVKPREKSQEEASEDRQLKTARTTTSATTTAGTQVFGGAVPPPPLIGTAADAEMDVDGCDVDFAANPTSDEQLPAAMGGVA